MQFEAGDRVDGLRIERELGRGAYGVVYLARDTLLGRLVALKVLPGGDASVSDSLRQAVLTEARLVANLNSPHIVTLYRLHPTDDGGLMQEMEFVEGGCLEDEMVEGQPMELERAVTIFRGVCLALKAAHAARVLHSDIKPGNILFGADGTVKLADFGLGRLLEGTGNSIQLEGQMVGTPFYMAPEVITGEEAGLASDLWSAAVLFYQLLTGQYPFAATNLGELMRGVLNEDPRPIAEEIPGTIRDLVLRCLAKSADDRPASAADVLRELAADQSVKAPAPRPAKRLTNLTPALTSFIGRVQEIEEIGTLLQDESSRLVTLLGPGGMGKTRLSQQICHTHLEQFAGGCWFADLAEIQTADGIGTAVAAALGVPQRSGEDPIAVVANALQYREPLLLVLDNFEQIIDHAAATVGQWLTAAGHVKFLVTSRALLGLAGEREYELHPLSTPSLMATLPGTAQAGMTFTGVQLFVERAREAKANFVLDDDNAAAVMQICAELDGMPLAIELAAARAKIMKPKQIAKKLNQKFQLLQSTRRDLTPRQQTLMGAISWSFDLLADWEREAFIQASNFRDGFTLEAAEAVLDLSDFEDAPLAMDIAQSLREKSLLTAYDTGDETRLSMYRSIRDYGRGKWLKSASDEQRRELSERHAEYYLDYVEEWNEHIPGMRDQEALDRIALEIGNLQLAQSFKLDSDEVDDAARIALAAAETMTVRRPPSQLVALLEQPLSRLESDSTVDVALLGVRLSAACQLSGDWNRAVDLADEAVERARASGDKHSLMRALLQQGAMRRERGNLLTAAESLAESEQLARGSDDKRALAVCTGELGMVRGQMGAMEVALEHFRTAEQLAREVGDNQTVALHVSNRGVLAEWSGHPDEAIACYREAEDISRRIGNQLRIAISLEHLANALSQTGDLEGALSAYREGETIARELGAKQRIAVLVGHRGTVHVKRDESDQALACYAEAVGIARELGDKRTLVVMLGHKAYALRHLERPDEALACYEEAEAVAEDMGDRLLVARSLCNRGSLLLALARNEDATSSLERGLRIAEEVKADKTVWYFSYKVSLAELAKLRGDEESAVWIAGEASDLARELEIDQSHPEEGVRLALKTVRELLAKN